MKKISAFLILIYCSANVSGQLPYLWVDSAAASPFVGSYSPELKIDTDGNIYTLAFGEDTAILKYDPSGQLLWSAPYADTLSSLLRCIEIAGDGSIYVVGGGNEHIVASKYSATGNLMWIKNYFHNPQSHFYSMHVTVGANDELIIATTEDNLALGWDNVIVVKYDSAGNQLWDYISPSTGFDGAFAVILDNNEDILITGVANYHFHPFYGVNGGDVFLMKLTANGALSWLSFFDAPDSSYDQGTCIAFDNEGNYYVTGWSKPWIENADGNSKLLILKFDVNGSLIWADSILNAVQNQNCGNESLYLINDRLLFAGVHVDSTGQQFLNASYDLSGNFLWQNVYSSPYGYPKSTCYRSILTKTKKVLNLVGEYSSDPSYPKPRLFEMDTLGNVMNTWKLDSLNAFHQEIQNVQQAQTGEYYLRGYINNGGGNTSVVTAKIEDITTGYQTIISENSLNIFPNPSSSSIFLSGFSFSKNGIEVTITDLTGNKSVQVNLISPSQTINVSALTSGMYLLQAKTSSGSFAGKVCIVH